MRSFRSGSADPMRGLRGRGAGRRARARLVERRDLDLVARRERRSSSGVARARARRGRRRCRRRGRRRARRRCSLGPTVDRPAARAATRLAEHERPERRRAPRRARTRAAPTPGTAPARCGTASAARRRARSARRRVSAPWLDDVQRRRRAARPEQDQREPGPADRQHREAEERGESATAPSAPGRTTPGWKISKPIPAIPARKSSEIRFGSISVFSSRVKKPGRRVVDLRVREVERERPLRVLRLVAVELLQQRGQVGAIRSITFIFSASLRGQVRRLAHGGAAHVVLRLVALRRARVSEAAASLITLRAGRVPMFSPLASIGVDEPMFDLGAIASTSAAWQIQTPAEAARAPSGET